eukprot:gene373-701_t
MAMHLVHLPNSTRLLSLCGEALARLGHKDETFDQAKKHLKRASLALLDRHDVDGKKTFIRDVVDEIYTIKDSHDIDSANIERTTREMFDESIGTANTDCVLKFFFLVLTRRSILGAMADGIRVLPFRIDTKRRWDTRNVTNGTKRSFDQFSQAGSEEELVVWAVRASDNRRVRFAIPVHGLLMYRMVCAFEGSTDDEEWLEGRTVGVADNFRRISDMRVIDSEGMRQKSGFEIRADTKEELARLYEKVRDGARIRTIRRDERAECGVNTFMRRRNLRPFSWWTVVSEEVREIDSQDQFEPTYELRDASGRYFEQSVLCLPTELPNHVRARAIRVFTDTPSKTFQRSGQVRVVVIAPLKASEPDEAGFYGEATSLEEEADLSRRALSFLRTNPTEVLAGPDPEADLVQLFQRAEAFVACSKETPPPSAIPVSAYFRLGRLCKTDVRAYAESMNKFRADTSLFLRVLRDRGVVFMELFVHSIARKPVHENCALRIREHDMDGVMPYVRHAYHDAGERMDPPQFVMPTRSAPRPQPQLPGGYNLPPSVGVHLQGVAVFDFRSFYPSCICSYNLGAGLVRSRDSSTPQNVGDWVPIVPLHIGDANSDACDCCRQRNIFQPQSSRVLREMRIGGRDMRVWQNDEDENTTYVCPVSQTRSVASELLQTLMECRDRMRGLKDSRGEMACKVLANSVFGVFGYCGGPTRKNDLYDAACYKTIVQLGRANLLRAVIALDLKGCSVIYGDTDSLFVGKSELQFQSVTATEVARSVTLSLTNAEKRPKLLDENIGATHTVELRAVENFSGITILAKKRYIASLEGGTSIKFCGFKREPIFSERCDRAFTEFCARLALNEPRYAGRSLDAMSTVADFLSVLSGKPNLTAAWFMIDGAKKQEGDASLDPAASVWHVVNQRMHDRSFFSALFGHADWRESRHAIKKMIRNHFEGAAPVTPSSRRSEILSSDTTRTRSACFRCKREEHFRPAVPVSDADEHASVIQHVMACEDRQCELWHIEIKDW